MKQLEKIFNYQSNEVRVVFVNDQPHFVAKDVCEILGISKHRDAISRLDEDERGSVLVDTLGGKQEMSAVNESGLYSLILTSRKPEAKAFKRWITHDVIPNIRQHGQYILPSQSQNLNLPLTYKDALLALVSEIDKNEQLQSLNEEQQLVIAEQTPKVEQYNTLLSAENYQNMNQVAKAYGWGRNQLYAFLREKKILMDCDSPYLRNIPYQQYMNSGYFKVIIVPIRTNEGLESSYQTLVTAKGVDFIGRLIRQFDDQYEQLYIEGYKQMEEAGVFSEFTY